MVANKPFNESPSIICYLSIFNMFYGSFETLEKVKASLYHHIYLLLTLTIF
ncbi:hypothetical protein HanXRQr2_Chr04g0166201 [Helianthus annuus]|uniref:Uncharacterized protein n=1 Tax=Helianthus annuus TaxID=4232 RepID=A0A9K3J853_HELAN|nr:hypothetical protein HanXRQr2_Chr04g0166201 [Helianthus annuus]KAJ0931284.1 hypothetical protein HanPSC8_Chr04g0159841 [Helianthus annuus]